VLKARLAVLAVFVALIAATVWLADLLPSEYTPQEDRGSFIILVNGPEGATFDYIMDYMDEIEARLTPWWRAARSSGW
jgi:multidrug efflux pump